MESSLGVINMSFICIPTDEGEIEPFCCSQNIDCDCINGLCKNCYCRDTQ